MNFFTLKYKITCSNIFSLTNNFVLLNIKIYQRNVRQDLTEKKINSGKLVDVSLI